MECLLVCRRCITSIRTVLYVKNIKYRIPKNKTKITFEYRKREAKTENGNTVRFKNPDWYISVCFWSQLISSFNQHYEFFPQIHKETQLCSHNTIIRVVAHWHKRRVFLSSCTSPHNIILGQIVVNSLTMGIQRPPMYNSPIVDLHKEFWTGSPAINSWTGSESRMVGTHRPSSWRRASGRTRLREHAHDYPRRLRTIISMLRWYDGYYLCHIKWDFVTLLSSRKLQQLYLLLARLGCKTAPVWATRDSVLEALC